jgi:hypothetical protein
VTSKFSTAPYSVEVLGKMLDVVTKLKGLHFGFFHSLSDAPTDLRRPQWIKRMRNLQSLNHQVVVPRV